MHLLVLSAFRPAEACVWTVCLRRSQCTFWCSVLSDCMNGPGPGWPLRGLNAPFGAQCFPTELDALRESIDGTSQCTFWCSVLSDPRFPASAQLHLRVSMHLLVLSAFRPKSDAVVETLIKCLNAPFGAQCFPTGISNIRYTRTSGSQCTFWCSVLSDSTSAVPLRTATRVSMHLLVLSAFRRPGVG